MYVEILYAIEHTLFVRLKYHRRFYFPYICMIYVALYQNSMLYQTSMLYRDSMLFCVCSFTPLCFEWVSKTKTNQV